MSLLERDSGNGNGPLIDVADVHVAFGRRPPLKAVDGVSLVIRPGESVGLVGESGCGKTTLGRCIIRLQDPTSGSVRFRGEDIAGLRGDGLRAYRRRVQMIFQDPYGSLNPRLSVGGALSEVLQVHGLARGKERRERAGGLLADVGLDTSYLDRYPHEFSGGQRQRVGIARALAVDPEVVIADEPVSALDVSVQVQILNLLRELRQRRNLAYLLVAHDLAVVRYVCDRVLVMYLGRIVEEGPAERIYGTPSHPYTRTLLAAVPDVEKALRARKANRRTGSATGEPAAGGRPEAGCLFAPRCPFAEARCRAETPLLRDIGGGQRSACHFAEKVMNSGAPFAGGAGA